MTSTTGSGRTLAAALAGVVFGLGCATTASADPGPTQPHDPRPADVSVPVERELVEPATAACQQFAAVLQVTSVNYNNFAYSIAGSGAHVDYQDPAVRSDNVDGRTVLRKAAGEALSTASTPGLSPAIANRMRAWSWQAAKLALAMGLRADGDTLNDAASELNREAEDTQMACADAGVQSAVGRRR
jgi:hypothetical protein